MNDDKTDWLKRMVREAGWSGIYTEWVSPTEVKSMTVPVTTEQVLKFAELVATAEREACAKVCDERFAVDFAGSACATAIRERSNKHSLKPEPDANK